MYIHTYIHVYMYIYIYTHIYVYIHIPPGDARRPPSLGPRGLMGRELRGSQGMGVGSNSWLDRVLL